MRITGTGRRWANKPPVAVSLNYGHPMAQGLIGCWLMNEAGGVAVYDKSKTQAHGAFTGSPTWTVRGGDHALSCSAADAGVTIGTRSDYNFTSGPFTIVVDFVPIGASETSGGVIVGRGLFQTDGFYFQIDSSANRDGVLFVSNQAGVSQNISAPASLTINQMNRCAVTRNGATGTIYVNGKAVGTSGGLVNPMTSTRSLYFGRYETAGTDFQGFLSRVLIYNRALSAAEVQSLAFNPYGMFSSPVPVARVLMSTMTAPPTTLSLPRGTGGRGVLTSALAIRPLINRVKEAQPVIAQALESLQTAFDKADERIRTIGGGWFQELYVGGDGKANARFFADRAGDVTMRNATIQNIIAQNATFENVTITSSFVSQSTFSLTLGNYTASIQNHNVGGVDFTALSVKNNITLAQSIVSGGFVNVYADAGLNHLAVAIAKSGSGNYGLVRVANGTGSGGLGGGQTIILDGSIGRGQFLGDLLVQDGTPANDLHVLPGNAATATAGAAALPANPVGFIRVKVGGTDMRIPYYAV